MAKKRPARETKNLRIVERSVDIPLEQIAPHPLNPRREFGDLKQLANSLATQGQLQEIVLQQNGDRYQLIAGERRFRAAQLAQLPTLRANVVDCDNAQALELLGRENIEREDFNAVEEARWLQQVIETTGLTQRALSHHLKDNLQLKAGRQMSQGYIGNRLRLLQLPETWQRRVTAGQLPESHARDLSKWSGRPQVLEQLEPLFRQRLEGGVLRCTVRDWQSHIAYAVDQVTRPAVPGQWSHFPGESGQRIYGHVDISRATMSKYAEDLDIVVVVDGRGRKQPRAFNCDLWDRLQREAAARKQARAQKREEQRETRDAEQGGLPANVDRKQRQRQKAFYRYRVEWLQAEIARQLPEQLRQARLQGTGTIPVAAVLWFVAELASRYADRYTAGAHGNALDDAVRRRRKPGAVGLTDLNHPGELLHVLGDCCTAWLQEQQKGQTRITPDDVERFARSIGIQFEVDWQPDERFWTVCTAAELRQVARAWKIEVKGGKSTIVETLADAVRNRRVPLPKCLTVKPCEIRW